MTSSYSTANKQSLANISSGERLVDPRHPENGSDALDRSKHLQNPHVINSSNPYPLHGSSKHTYHQLTGGHTQPPQAPGLTPYHYIHNPQLELDLQSAAGFDYGAAFGNPFESQSAMHYLPDSQFVGYRPADAYALGFESQLHNSFGPNGNSKTAATPQYSYGSHASRYGNQSYPPSQQYPDTQLLQPTFAHPSENMNPSRTVADSKVGSRNPQDCNSNIVSTSPSRGHVMTHQEYQQPGAGDPGFNMQLCAPQNPFMFAPFHPTSYPSQNERLTVGPTEMSSNSQAPNATGSLGSAVATSGSTSSMRRKNASRETTAALKTWLFEHRKNPYPTKGEKIMLAIITKMSLTQISTWFANARRRLKKENKMTWTPKNKTNNNSQSHKENKLNHTAATDNIEATKLSTGEILENEADVTFDSLDSELKLEN